MPPSYHIPFQKSIFLLAALSFLFLAHDVLARTPNDPEFATQTPFWSQIKAEEAWNYTIGSRRVVIAVIDTGADIWHNDLRGNIWINNREIEGNGIDDDRNGYVDDLSGWNFAEGNNDVRTSVFEEDADPEAVGHGTIVAGLTGARGDNGRSGTGLNWQIQIMPLRAMRNDGSGSYRDVVKAINYAMNNGAQIISMSFVGNERVQELETALKQAYDRGILIVSAAGNDRRSGEGDLDTKPRFPVCLDNNSSENWILGVSSVNGTDRLSSFADYGSCIDLVAPGEGIFSTLRYAPRHGFPSEFGGPWRGTSFAVPLVAGAAGLIKSLRPEWNAAEIINMLLQTADNIDSQNPDFIGKIGRGRLNVGRAVSMAALSVPRFIPPTYLYYSTRAEIKRYKFFTRTHESVISLRGISLKNFTAADLNYDGAEEIILLFKRGKFVYAGVWDNYGSKIREFFVAEESGGWQAREIKSNSDTEGALAVRLQNSTTGASKFLRFNKEGEKTGEIINRRGVSKWNMLDSSKLILAVNSRNQKKFDIVDWYGTNLKSSVLPGVSEVLNVAGGAIWDKVSTQAVAVVKRGQKISELVVDLATDSVFEEPVGRVVGNALWSAVVLQPNGLGMSSELIFHNRGGSFSISNGRGAIFEYLEIPAVSSTAGFVVY